MDDDRCDVWESPPAALPTSGDICSGALTPSGDAVTITSRSGAPAAPRRTPRRH